MGRIDVEELLRRLDQRGFADASDSVRSATRASEGEGARASADPQDLPDRLGPFDIVGELGEGGFGVVLLGAQREPVR